jgi:hypothetical protein
LTSPPVATDRPKKAFAWLLSAIQVWLAASPEADPG